MAFVGLAVPTSTSRLFSDIDVPGDKTPRDQHHVTLIYVGDNLPIDTLAEVIKATYSVTAQTRPFTVRTTRVASFPVNGDDQDGHPVIAHIESDELHVLRANLADHFKDARVDFNQKFPKYKPHVTLAYAPAAVEEFRIPTIEWGAHEVILWGGDHGDQKLTVTFPLALSPSVTAADAAMTDRVVERFRSANVAARYVASTTPR
jgi:2'-5' RNA ligase